MTVEQHALPVELSQPLDGATAKQAAGRFWRKYVVFSGRASRSEYWWWYLVSSVVSLILTGIDIAFAGHLFVPAVGAGLRELFVDTFARSVKTSIASWSWALVTFIGQLAVTVRRLHDTNRSGWWYLFILVPIAGPIALIVILAEPPTSAGQRFDR